MFINVFYFIDILTYFFTELFISFSIPQAMQGYGPFQGAPAAPPSAAQAPTASSASATASANPAVANQWTCVTVMYTPHVTRKKKVCALALTLH